AATRLISAATASDCSHDSPIRCISAIRVPVTNSQAEAPNTVAAPAQARARPNALRASAKSAEASRRSARSVPRLASSASRRAALIAARLSSRPGAGPRPPSPAPASCGASPATSRRLPVAAAGELGDDPAGGEGDAEGSDRALADQVGGAVDQVAPLVHQHVHLLLGRAAAFLERGDAGQRRIGQVGLDRGTADLELLAGDLGGVAD